MVATSFPSSSPAIDGSTKNDTGNSLLSPGNKSCSVKQKHSILLKYFPIWRGVTLKVAVPRSGSLPTLVAVNATNRSSPSLIWTGIGTVRCHARPGATLASKRTVMTEVPTAPGAVAATWVVPAKPVTWQNNR